MPYNFYLAAPEKLEEFTEADIPISGFLEDLVCNVDIILDATTAGNGEKNKV
ncbi:hypothetical protein [Mesotoga sp.]|uniref:hypothetical protein n=1 Tax=Mesotoga sp. TaxID=2053577 RepID=UPI00345EDAC3